MSHGAQAGAGGSGPSNLALRIVSGLALGLLALGLTWLGGTAFRLFAAILAGLVFHEWMAMDPPANRVHSVLAWAVLIVALAAMLAGGTAALSFAAMGAAIIVAFAHSILTSGKAWSVYGIAYAGLPAVALALLRGSDTAGLVAVLFLFAVVWATDILAYFTGRALGGPKLAPRISPGKTWSGAIGGTLGGIVGGVAVVLLAPTAMPVAQAVPLALVLSVLAQCGDLFESALKRRRGIKDSGTLVPGHGGVMDRVDGLVAAAVLLYLLGIVFSGLAAPAGLFFG